MPRRFLVIAIVFAVGFGVGWGATWLIVGPGGGAPEKSPQPVATPTSSPTRVAAADVSQPPTEPAPTATANTDAGPAAADAEAPTDVAATPEEVAPATAPPPTIPPATDPATPPDSEAGAWWNACQGKTCVVDWGKVSGGISVRAGELEHGADVDWASTFAKADKVGTLEAKKGMKVEVLAVGMAEGKPVAAWIKYRKIKGVIALNFGDKSIRFIAPK